MRIWGILVVVGLMGLLTSCGVSDGYVLRISQAEIQAKLDENFPIEKEYLIVFKVTLRNPQVTLQEGSNRLDFQIEAATNVDIKDHPIQGQGKISGEVRYDPQTGEFYLDNATVEALELADLPDKYAIPLRLAASLGVRQYLNRKPIYTLKPQKFKQAVAKLILQDVIVEQGVLKITLGVKP